MSQSSRPTAQVPGFGSLVRELESELKADPAGAADRLAVFWAEVERRGTPLIEPDPEHPGFGLVTFLVREREQSIAEVSFHEPASWLSDETRGLARVAGSDVWARTLRCRDDLRSAYRFEVRYAGEKETVDLTDPLARTTAVEDWSPKAATAELVMPRAEALPWLEGETAARGELHEHVFDSGILGNSRSVWVHTPAGFSAEGGPYPFVVIFDGVPWHSGPAVIDRLTAAGEIRPMVAVLVSPEIDGVNRRDEELTGVPEFSRMIAEELVPWARERYRLSEDPADAAVNGRSYGGLCSAYTALKHPGVFGKVLMQSGSCWYHRSLPQDRPDFPDLAVGVDHLTPLIIEEYRTSDRAPVRIYQEVGTVENGPQVARIWQTFANRWFRDVLDGKGYDHTYREFVGGHDDAWWRGTFADGVRWLFGK